MIENSLSIIKPDAVERNIIGKIITMIEEEGLELIAQKMIHISEKLAKEFYYEHKDRVFFKDLIKYMTSYPVIVQVIRGENAISKYRELMGVTDPRKAKINSIRNRFGLDIEANSVHGSENLSSAQREISLFFSPEEIFM
ncbi:MAG: nucleoside-diphosphate kinase [Rickettsia sp.]|nr:nucleoside-diphosphate kinase [Rickettsia sp.]